MTRRSLSLLSLCAVLFLMSACTKAPLRLETIQLGRGLNPDNSVSGHTTSFNASDTIYVAVLTDAAGTGTVGVRWTYGGQVIGEPSRQVSYNGPAATAFPLVNSGGFPPGNYTVEVFIDSESVGSRNFRVE